MPSFAPSEPVTAERRSVLEINLENTDARLNELTCLTGLWSGLKPFCLKNQHRAKPVAGF